MDIKPHRNLQEVNGGQDYHVNRFQFHDRIWGGQYSRPQQVGGDLIIEATFNVQRSTVKPVQRLTFNVQGSTCPIFGLWALAFGLNSSFNVQR
jgi:hypothetical protein